ncbi:MAG: hypothetical protein NC417_03245 [Candidatus Gastranaerophilales bacterium]|nr:hypothetical protein [Candidatus Gastranaerophilales bacterium]
MEETEKRNNEKIESQGAGQQESVLNASGENAENAENTLTDETKPEEKKASALEAEGFVFYTEKDAELARQERRKVQYLKAHMDHKKPAGILNLYEKAIAERVFKTPVGLVFLKEIQNYLVKQSEIDDMKISPIPLFVTYDGEIREHPSPARRRVQPAPKKKESPALPISIAINIVLAIAIAAMFVITLTAEQPNILNYERALLNRYAGWEQQLTEREQAIREAERELQLQNE